jgi:hypothetical protein
MGNGGAGTLTRRWPGHADQPRPALWLNKATRSARRTGASTSSTCHWAEIFICTTGVRPSACETLTEMTKSKGATTPALPASDSLGWSGFIAARQQARLQPGRHPEMGSPRYAYELDRPGLRSWPPDFQAAQRSLKNPDSPEDHQPASGPESRRSCRRSRSADRSANSPA